MRSVLAWALVAVLAPNVAAAAGDATVGKEKAQQCAVCHGIDGISKKPDAPNIAGQMKYYLRTLLTAFRSGKRFHQQMNVVAQSLSDEDINDLAAWYSSIRVTVELPPD